MSNMIILDDIELDPTDDAAVFNYVVDKLARQKAKSVIHVESICEEICAYRGNDGMKCAAGHLMPDKEYHEDFEGVLFIEIAFFNSFNPKLIARLQYIHDNVEINCWNEDFKDAAEEFNISYTDRKFE